MERHIIRRMDEKSDGESRGKTDGAERTELHYAVVDRNVAVRR